MRVGETFDGEQVSLGRAQALENPETSAKKSPLVRGGFSDDDEGGEPRSLTVWKKGGIGE